MRETTLRVVHAHQQVVLLVDIASGVVLEWRTTQGYSLPMEHEHRHVTWCDALEWIVWCAVHEIDHRQCVPELFELRYRYKNRVQFRPASRPDRIKATPTASNEREFAARQRRV